METENQTNTSRCDETTKNSLAVLQRKISASLTDCSILRGGVLGREAKALYVSKLVKLPLDDVLMALEKLGELERREYEPAIPEVGGLIALVNTMTIARQNRAEAEKNRKLVHWWCPDCGYSMTGFPMPREGLERRCQSTYKRIKERRPGDASLPSGQICGALMHSEEV